jgi:hypothetical protein
MKTSISLLFLLIFSAPLYAKRQEGQSIYHYCKQQGYSLGTADFQDCCVFEKDKERSEAEQCQKQWEDREFSGQKERDRVRKELDVVPKDGFG